MLRPSNFKNTFHLKSLFNSTISRVTVSAFLLILLCHGAKADPVVILGGTITASSNVQQAISGSLQVLDPQGNPFLVTFSSQGGPLDFHGAPGTPVTFQAGIAGDADQGNAAIEVHFNSLPGTVIPVNANTATLDLIGSATITFQGSACQNNCLVDPVLFTYSGGFTGPVALHFIRIQVGDQFQYQLTTASATFTNVPEPVSMLLFGSGLVGSSLVIRRRRYQNTAKK